MENVVITGTSSGFGYLTSLTLALKGYKVWATMRQSNGKNASAKKKLLNIAQKEGLDINILELDVTSDESVNQAINEVVSEDAKIDYLVNNAGVMYVGITEAYSIDQAKDQFDTNVFGIHRTVKAVTPYMRSAKKGLIINVTSIAGRLVFPYFGLYCASKFAVEAYSQSLRYELSPFGIEVALVEPGPFGTQLIYSGPEEADRKVFDAYGEHKDIPRAMLNNFERFFQSEDAVDPMLVADDILHLIQQERGARPFRVVSGIDYGTKELNDKIAPIQKNVVKDSLQLGHLLELAI